MGLSRECKCEDYKELFVHGFLLGLNKYFLRTITQFVIFASQKSLREYFFARISERFMGVVNSMNVVVVDVKRNQV